MRTQDQTTGVVAHLTELRKRLLYSFIVLGVTSIIGLFFAKRLYHWLSLPLLPYLPQGSSFIVTSPFESYITYFKVAFTFGFLISLPVMIYQALSFVFPALKPHEKKLILPLSLMAGLFFTGGACFGYSFVFPALFASIQMILEGTGITLLPRMDNYFSIAVTMLLAFGFSFELPLFIFILGKIGIVTHSKISSFRRMIIVILFVLAAILTPGPDIISQCLLAIPLWILFELGVFSLWVLEKKKKGTVPTEFPRDNDTPTSID